MPFFMKLSLLIDPSSYAALAATSGKPTTMTEKIFSCAVIVIFGLIGLGLLRAGLREFFKVRSRRPFLIKLPGTVTSVVKERETRAGSTNNRNETAVVIRFIPMVSFTTPEGKHVDFRSEVCDIHHLKRRLDGSLREVEPSWRSGQSVEVLYDPGAVLKPHLTGGAGLSFMAYGMMAAGLLTFGAAVGLSFVFYSKVFR